MSVVLINPGSSMINKSWGYRNFFTPIAPLGLCYIAAVLRDGGVEVFVLDQFANKMTNEEVAAFVAEKNPRMVGFSVLTPVVPDVKKLSQAIRSACGAVTLVAGNTHPTSFPEDLLKDGTVDVVVRGEGEMTMRALYRALADATPLQDVLGITFRSAEGVISNDDRPLVDDLDTLPFPAWDLLDLDYYTEVPLGAIHKSRAVPIMISRGCTYRCYYCSQDKIYPVVRYRSLDKAIEEMAYFYETHQIKYFGISDAYFPFDEESGLAFCERLMATGLHTKIKWCTETRVDKVSARLLQAMKKAGAHLIMYGVEVGNEKVLGTLNKGTTLEQARFAIRETKRAGIFTLGLFMIGLPGDTAETCRETIAFAKQLDCDLVKFNIAVPYPGSQFFKDFEEVDTIRYEKYTSWYDWTLEDETLIYCPDHMTGTTLRAIQRRGMFEYYVRPRMIVRHLWKRSIPVGNLLFGFVWLVKLLFVDGLLRWGKQVMAGRKVRA